jgi:hypothetical protein
MADYNCTLLGCVSAQTGTYSTLASCKTSCVGWGCQPSPNLSPNADILFVFDASGSLPVPTVQEYFKATTAWTETLTQNGWTGDANWVVSQAVESSTFNFIDISGNTQSTYVGTEEFLGWGSIPYIQTNRDASGNKVYDTTVTVSSPACPSGAYCDNMTLAGNPTTGAGYHYMDLPGVENYFTKYTLRPNIATTGLTFPMNDQLVITVSQINQSYNYGSPPGNTPDLFKTNYALWDVVRAGGALNGRNYEGYSIPATYYEPAWFNGGTITDVWGSVGNTRQELITRQQMFMAMSPGNQDDTSLTGATGTLDGTWVIIPYGHQLPNYANNGNGGTCLNLSGCSTFPGGEASENPCVEASQFNESTPNVPQYNATWIYGNAYNPCYTSVIHIDNAQTGPGYINVHEFKGHRTINSYGQAVAGLTGNGDNPYWDQGYGDLERKGWKHRYHDSTFNNPQNDLANLLNIEISDASTWVPVDCFSAETLNTVNSSYPYSSYALCQTGSNNCPPKWHCDGLGTPCYSAYTSGSTGSWYENEALCQANCNTTTPYWSCTTEGCESGFTVTQHLTKLECQENCVGWGCESVATLADFYLYVYYDLTSMGVDNIKIAYSAVTDWVISLPVQPNDVHHIIVGDEEWLRWAAAPFMSSAEMLAWGQSGWGTQENRLSGVTDWFGTLPPSYQVGSWHDNITTGDGSWELPVPPHIDGSATGRTLSDKVLNLVFLDETENHGIGGYVNLNAVYQNSLLDPLYAHNSISEPSTEFKNDYEFYVSKYKAVTEAGGGITNFIYPTCPTQFLGDPPPLKAMYTYTALHMVASIDSGNQDQLGGTGTLDGTWIWGTQPTSSICSLAELAAQPNPYYDEVNNVSPNSSNYGGLDQFGWGYNVGFVGMDGTVLANDLNNFITNSASVTITTQFATCLSAETNYLTHPTHSSATEAQCWIDCSVTGFTCTPIGCNYGFGPDFPYDSLSECEDVCTSYDCSTTGCTLYNEPGSPDYTGSGNFGTGGTHESLAICLNTACVSYDCSASGCTQYNISAGTPSYLNGSGGTGGAYFTSSCDDLCSSFDCTTTGCTDYNISAGTASYALFDGSPLQGYGGTGGTHSYTATCSAVCISYECTDYGCVIYNDPEQDWAPGYTNGHFGSGGTFSSLATCTAACQSFACETGGCEEWNASNASSDSYQYAHMNYDLGGNFGTGGTPTLAACTAQCFTWECATNGCISTVGDNPNAYPWNMSATCNSFCTSHNCTSSGCVAHNGGLGSGGTYTGNTSLQDCENGTATLPACVSYLCNPLTNSVHPNDSFATWNYDSCGVVAGTGTSYNVLVSPLMSPFSSLTQCQSACTSWSCQYEGNYYEYPDGTPIYPVPNGCLQFANTGSSTSQLTYDACTAQTVCERYDCTDTGCIPGDHVTGMYDSYNDCTGGTATLPACQSLTCSSNSYYTYNGPSNITTPGTVYGTGGTWTGTDMYLSASTYCKSYNCTNTGCSEQVGFGGMYYDPNDPSNAAAMCQAACVSYVCLDEVPDGVGITSPCVIYNSTPGTPGYVNGFSGSGGTFDSMYSCGTDCISWNCTDDGCISQLGTGGTFTTKAACTGSCQSFACATTGCTGYNDPLYPNSPGYTDGEYGTGGTYTLSAACTASCVSYNCTETGCVVTGGTQGMYADLPTCNTACSSWDCLSSGCTEYNISAGTPSYTTGSGGTGGTYFNSSCDNECSSFDCTSTGCTEYNVISGTASYGLFNGTVYQGHGGTGGTYTGASCDNFCYSYECVDIETTSLNWGWNDDGCIQQIGTGSTFYSGIVSLVGVQNSYTACTAQCRSWSCVYPSALSDGCLEFPNTGNSQTFLSLTSCTADTQCERYDCTDYGCVPGNHITGTYADLPTCEAACTSYECDDNGCDIWNDIGSGTYTTHPGGGTGGTFTTSNCDDLCRSYNCISTGVWSFNGCTNQPGSGGTFFNLSGPSFSIAQCYTACTSWSCENPNAVTNGCLNYPNTGNTTYDMWESYIACTAQTVCERWDCTPEGCIIGSQVTGQYDTFEECTGGTVANNNTDACQSWSCTETGTTNGVGCEVFNGPNSVGVTSTGALNYVPGPMYGTYGTGGTNTTSLANCNVGCNSWNCLDTGCTEQIGWGGAYDNDTCSTIGGVQNICYSFECDPYSEWDVQGCNQYAGSGSTFFNIGGTVLSLADCQSACTSWSCQNTQAATLGCLEYPNTGNTLSQPTYSACTADTVCWRYDCTSNGCIVGSQTGGTYDSLADCLTGTTILPACESWQCTDTGCEEWNSPSYPASPHYIDGTRGTGGTNTISMINCDSNCRSYECMSYGCEDYGGTGHTYISTVAANEYTVWLNCVDNCKSWDCVPVNNWQQDNGCQIYNNSTTPFVGFGTGGTYTAATCDSGCTSWRCIGMGTFGCTEFPNTASTYSSYTSCTANTECKSYDCTVSGCIERNYEWMGGIDSYTSMTECKEACVGWACIRDIISTGTTIYAYYDISNLKFSNILNQRIKLQNYIDSNYPTFTGNIYHTLVSDGRWLDWANSIYSGEFSVSPGTGALPKQPTSYYDERALLGIVDAAAITPGWLSEDWHDQYSAGTYVNIGINSAAMPGGQLSSITTKGIAPTANTSSDVLVISFITEADGVESPQGSVISNIYGYHDSTTPGNSGNPLMVNQPMIEWKQDYTAYTANYNTITGNSGTIRALLYPVRIAGSNTIFNPQSTKMCLLQALASIDSGNQTISDGTWLQNTAPTTPGNGGAVGFVPELCYANLDQLESVNPYWTTTTPTWGGLDQKGWTVNIEGTYLGGTNYTGFLDDYLSLTTTGLTAGTCVSAETLYTDSIAYSLSSETECDTACVPTMYLCTTTGCTLSWDGYLTLTQCTNKCKSVSCTTVGCEYYNSPGSLSEINGYYGSGGTFTGGMGSGMMLNCYEVCTSTNCNGYPNNLSQQGCIQQSGTGGTWTGINQYSACTGSCKSWSCDDPCQYETALYTLSSGGTGCVEYPNTGATHIELTACTATCQENYYCITGLTANTCSELIDSGIISADVKDHIDAIATSTSPNDWTNTPFKDLKFILTSVTTPPINGCYNVTNNGYWSRVISIVVEVTVGAMIPDTYTFVDWNDLLNVMNNSVLTTPMTEINDIMNIPNVDVTINTEFCECTTSDCSIGCTNTGSLPANSSGFYPTYVSAQTTCCPVTTWVCSANTTVDNCDGLTLIPGLYASPEECYSYLNSYYGLPNMNFTNFKCEIPPVTNSVLAECEIGPNYGQLIKLTGITVSIPAISSNVYTNWSGLTTALQGLSPTVPFVGSGQTSLLVWLLTNQVYPGAEFTYGWIDCECDNPYTCDCVEISGTGGTYTSQTLCEEVCCSSTTWNCVQNNPYLPICDNKQFLGVGTSEMQIFEHYRLNSPTSLFGLDKWVMFGATYTTNEVNNLVGAYGWGDDCYHQIDSNVWLPYKYLYSVSHPLINGGTLYQTWDEFFNAVDLVVTACTTSDTVTDVNNKINSFFGQTIFELELDFKACCSSASCYCYDTLTTGGDYNSETLCDAGCCPTEIFSWSCRNLYDDGLSTSNVDVCLYGAYGPPLNQTTPGNGPWGTWAECNQLSLKCAKSWQCSVLTPTSVTDPCFGEPCIEVNGHYDVTSNLLQGIYPTKFSCETNTDLDCCGPEYLWICVSSETQTTMSGLTIVPDNAGTLGYHSSDEFLTYLADPTASPSRQYSAITAFTFCKFESGTTVLNAAEESCKCGDGCDGIFHSANYIVFNDLLSGSGSNALPYHPSTNPFGYCNTWSDMITQLNTVWDPTGTLNVNLNNTFDEVVSATTDVFGNVITISAFGLDSCVDITGPCGCEPCYTPNCGSSKQDCEDICCQPIPTTWTCTMNGCLDVCNGKGEFSSMTECKEVCYEWSCMDDVWGCTDSGATNYNPLATIDDGTCLYPTNRWSCLSGGTCTDKIDTGAGGLSFTSQIYNIAANSSLHEVPLNTLKWGLGGGNNHRNQLPAEPCDVPGQNWGQPGPYYAYIKYVMYSGLPNVQYTTWKSFIDAINSLGYTFQYGNPSGTQLFGWQDLEAILGANQLHCEWDWCDCGQGCNCVPDEFGPYLSELGCDSDTNNCCESWDCQTTYLTNTCSGMTDIGFVGTVLWPHEPLEFMVNNGYQSVDVNTLKWIFNNPAPSGVCTINGNTQHWSHYVDITVGDTNLGSTTVQTWDDAIGWLNTNFSLGLLPTMPYSTVYNIITPLHKYIKPNLGVCYCTGIECECVEVFDGSGAYNTSAHCKTSLTSCCFVPQVIPESYDCDCGSATTWNCVAGTPANNYLDNCSGKTFLNVDWWDPTVNPHTSGLPGMAVGAPSTTVLGAAPYFANPANGLQFATVGDYTFIDEHCVADSACINSSSANRCTMNGQIAASAQTNQYIIRNFKYVYTPNNNNSTSHAVFENALNYDAVSNSCPWAAPYYASGCIFDSWADFITGTNMAGVTDNNGSPLTLSSTYQEAKSAVSGHWGIAGSIIRTYNNQCTCFGTPGTPGSCVEVAGASGTYATEFDCHNDANTTCYDPTAIPQPITSFAFDSCASKIDAGVGSFFVSTQLYFDFINVNFGANADIGDYKHPGLCQTNASCPVPYQVGMCYTTKSYWQTSYFGNPANLSGGVESPNFNTFQEIVDWFNLVATTEGYAGGFNTSMTIDDMMILAVSQNTYTTQDYCNAGPNTPWGCTNQVPPAMGSSGGGIGCSCTGGASSPCNCVDPGDGSGMYSSVFDCQNTLHSDCYSGTTSSGPCASNNCSGTIVIPDSNFENFLETHSGTTSTNVYGSNNVVATWPNTMGNGVIGDNLIEYSGICCVTQLNLDNQFISDLTGISLFSDLMWLNAKSNQLTILDVSSNVKLETLNVSSNNLTTIDISTLPLLGWLSCQHNELTTVDTSNNPNLYQFLCYSQQNWNTGGGITSLDLSQNPLMKYLQIQQNQLTTLDLSMLPLLWTLRCGNNQLTTLDVINNTDLREISVEGNQLTTLDLSNQPHLTDLYYSNNQFTIQVDISNNPLLKRLSTGYQPIGALDLSQSTSLEYLDCTNCGLTTLDVSVNTGLQTLWCGNNSLNTLDVSLNTSLTMFYCQNSGLNTLVLGGSINLNNITGFLVTGNTNLTIHVGSSQRVLDFQTMFVAGTHYDVGTNIVI